MTGVLLALGAAAAYGLSDFVGGVASRRTSVWPVAFTACLGAAVGSLLLALLLPGRPGGHDLAWGALGGIGSGVGTAFLYRGFARGRMGVVGPVSAVGAALLPAAVGVLTDERPSALVWVGMVLALPGIWLVSQEPAAPTESVESAEPGPTPGTGRVPAPRSAPGLADGVLAGAGFGLLFAALGQVPEGAGYWPVLVAQLVSLVAVVTASLLLGGDPRPRVPGHWLGLVAGLTAATAVVGFVLARQQGLLSVSAVLTSLYPAATVLLAVVVLHERLHRVQTLGLALCGVSVACVVLG